MLCVMSLGAQNRDKNLTIAVTTTTHESLKGQAIGLTQTDYAVGYGTLTLDANGRCSVKVYAGPHKLTVSRSGYQTAEQTFTVSRDTTVNVTLKELVTKPYALDAKVSHDIMTGRNDIALSWNTQAPVFSDDFESYDAFSVKFGAWTGIDADQQAAAALEGDYPNRGALEYAQIINPLAVTPTWWYSYPVLRPRSGKQYAGFIRTSSGNANDDWLISPAFTPGTDNVLTFYAKAADAYPERFQVYVTTKTGNPTRQDFTRLDEGNYEQVDYKQWHKMQYSLAAYEGKPVKFAIRYIGDYNTLRSFMLMIDDVSVGQAELSAGAKAPSRRVSRRSPRNPNEQFNVFLDGNLVKTTSDYSCTLTDVATGSHTVGVQATYIDTQSETTNLPVNVSADNAKVTFNVSAESKLSANGQHVNLTNQATGEGYTLTVADGKVTIPSLSYGTYLVNIEEGAFNSFEQTYEVKGDASFSIQLTDKVRDPFNISADVKENADGTGNVALRWNQDFAFSDSFESYADFSTGAFGPWKSIDADQMPVYPISLNNTIISFPGSGTATNPKAIAPIVFNPSATTPAMLPTDKAMAPPTGNKEIVFFSPQGAQADKWLISPELNIRDGYKLQVTAKSYAEAYPETLEFAVSTQGDNPSDFTVLSTAAKMPADQWTKYETDLSAYSGKKVRVGIHYTSKDTFFAQLDDFRVGPAEGAGATVDYGNVVNYDVFLDGGLVGRSDSAAYELTNVSAGTHTVGVRAVYMNSESKTATHTFTVKGKPVVLNYLNTGYRYKKAGETLDVFAQFKNTGAKDISKYVANLDLDGKVYTETVSEAVKVESTDAWEHNLTLAADIKPGRHVVKVYISSINDSVLDEKPMIADSFYVYTESFARQMTYLEQYADEDNVYSAASNSIIAQSQKSAKTPFALVNVYRDGNPLAIAATKALCDRYAYTWPSFTLDRSYYPGESHIAYDFNSYSLGAPSMVVGILNEMLGGEYANPAFATIAISPSFDASSRTLKVEVSGKVAADYKAMFGNVALTVMLTEDSIDAPQTIYSGGAAQEERHYLHNNVLRQYLSAADGDKLELSGFDYSAAYSAVLPATYDASRLRVVAIITRYAPAVTDANVMTMDVLNSYSVKVSPATGIGSPTLDKEAPRAYFSIDGRRLDSSALPNGVVIEKLGGRTRKIIIKH